MKLLQYLKHKKEINDNYEEALEKGLCNEMSWRQRLAYWLNSLAYEPEENETI